MNLSARERGLAAVVGAVLVGAVLFLVVYRWAIPKWTTIRDRIERKEEELADLNAVVNSSAQHKADYEARASLALRQDSPQAAEAILLNRLYTLADEASMKTPNITALSTKGEDHYDIIKFDFKVKCTLPEFLAFTRHFYDLEGAHRIDTVSLKPGARYSKTDEPISVTMYVSAVVIPEGGKKPPKKRTANLSRTP